MKYASALTEGYVINKKIKRKGTLSEPFFSIFGCNVKTAKGAMKGKKYIELPAYTKTGTTSKTHINRCYLRKKGNGL